MVRTLYFLYLFIYWLCWLLITVHRLCLVAVCRLLIVVAPLVMEQPLQVHGLVVVHWLSCSKTRGIFLDQESNSYTLHCKQTINHRTTKEALEDKETLNFTYLFSLFNPVFLCSSTILYYGLLGVPPFYTFMLNLC